jgi:ribosome-binding factor A
VTARTKRIDALLREEISELVTREVQDPGIGFLTVTGVETAPDLGHARVWVSVIGSDVEKTATLRALERAMPFVRRRLGERLRLKRIPELMVRPDPTVERGTRLMHIIQDLEEGKTPEPLPDELPTPSPRPAVIAGRKRPRPSSSGRSGSRSAAKSRRDPRHDR